MAAHAGFSLVVVACVAAGAVDGSNRRHGVANCIGRRRTNRNSRPTAGETSACCTGPAGSSSRKIGLALSRWPTGLKPEQPTLRANEYVIAFLHAFDLWGHSVTTKGGCPFSPASLVACHNVAAASGFRMEIDRYRSHIVPFLALGVSQPCSSRPAGFTQSLHFNLYLQRRKVKARRGGCTSIHR